LARILPEPANAGIEQAAANAAMRSNLVKGRVEDTLPESAPQRIALLRLDTDWYESTYHELVHLYSHLSPGGVLLIDDYGHWAGSRKATNQYFKEQAIHPLLHRIDYGARLLVKPLHDAQNIKVGFGGGGLEK
jgi:hypothetical protein